MSSVELSMNRYNVVARFSDDVTRRPNMCVVISIPEKTEMRKKKCNFGLNMSVVMRRREYM